jgi:hypothetical protein
MVALYLFALYLGELRGTISRTKANDWRRISPSFRSRSNSY